jgi:hypothetical protein
VQKTVDATLKPGEVAVDDYGVPAQATQVERKVYAPSGALLSDETWYSSYRSEPKIIRVGPKKQPKQAAKKSSKEQPAKEQPATTPATTR